jgi:ribokinase
VDGVQVASDAVLVCTLGDLLLDVIVHLDRALAAGDDVTASTRVCAGGQAANVAAWAAALGARARFVGRRGDDPAGVLVSAELEGRGVELAGPVGGRTGVVVALVGDDRDRSMASDRGAAAELRAETLAAEWFRGCDWLHVSGYLLSTDDGAAAGVEAARMARAFGAQVSVDAGSATLVERVGAGRFAALGPDLLFATEAEYAALGRSPADATIVVKRGALGCRIVEPSGETELPAQPVTPVDATGAGDAFAAGYLVGGPELALAAGARCVATSGAMP